MGHYILTKRYTRYIDTPRCHVSADKESCLAILRVKSNLKFKYAIPNGPLIEESKKSTLYFIFSNRLLLP